MENERVYLLHAGNSWTQVEGLPDQIVCSDEVVISMIEEIRHPKQQTDVLPNQVSQCEICGQIVFDLELHMNLMHNEMIQISQCEICDENVYNLEVHMNLMHNEVMPLTCGICYKSFYNNRNLEKHVRTHPAYKCNYCNEVFTSEETLKQHKGKHTTHRCEICKIDLKNEQNLFSHNMVFHTVNFGKTLKCNYCGALFSTKSTYENHVKTHSNEPFKCYRCLKEFKEYLRCVVHEQSCSGKLKYQCDYCKRKFSCEYQYSDHVRIHTREKLRCAFCKKIFTEKLNCETHEKMCTGLVRKFKCSYCGRQFSSEYRYDDHVRTHTNEVLECYRCTKEFTKKFDCVQHEYTCAVEEKFLKCSYCGEVFKSEYRYDDHIRTHTKETLKCSHCGDEFTKKYNWVVHEESCTGDEIFKCQHCPKTFLNETACIFHERSHKTPPYKCTLCEFESTFLLNIRNHMRKCLALLQCQICLLKFSVYSDYLEHADKHPNERIFKCFFCNEDWLEGPAFATHHKICRFRFLSKKNAVALGLVNK